MKSSNERNPVILLHGLWDKAAIFNTMSGYLKQLGWSVFSLDMIPSNGSLPLEKLAQQVADFVDINLPPEQPFDLIGFSMGGIVGRYYLQRLGGIDRVERFISISSPHNGTATGFASWHPGCSQMRIGSSFLADLNGDISLLNRLNFTSIWTPYDLMIVPATSSKVPVGKDVEIPVLVHAWMVADARVLKVVTEALTEPVKINQNTTEVRLETRFL